LKRNFYLIIFILAVFGCKAGKTPNSDISYQTFDLIDKPDVKPVETISPTNDYIVYEFKSSPDSGLTGGMSTVFVVRKKDNKVLLKENYYIENITWFSDEVARFHIRQEVAKKTKNVNVIDFDVRTMEKTSIKSRNNIK